MNTKLSLQEMQLEWDKAHGLYKPTPPSYWNKRYLQLSMSEAGQVEAWNEPALSYWLQNPELEFTEIWYLVNGDKEYKEE